MGPSEELARLEKLAPHYDSGEDFDLYILRSFAAIVAPRVRGKRVLDLGCSSGSTSEGLVDSAGALDLIDGSAHYIEVAKQRVRGPHVRYFQSLFEAYEPDVRYDHIICSHVLEHVIDPVEILSTAKNWLAEGGVIWAFVPNAFSVHRRLGVAMGVSESLYELSPRDHRIGHRRVYDPQSLAKDIRAAGLRHGDLHGIMLKPMPIAKMGAVDPAMIEGFVKLGIELPELASDIYYEAFV